MPLATPSPGESPAWEGAWPLGKVGRVWECEVGERVRVREPGERERVWEPGEGWGEWELAGSWVPSVRGRGLAEGVWSLLSVAAAAVVVVVVVPAVVVVVVVVVG